MICANCKRNVPEQAAYCPYCGAALSAAVTAKRKRKSKKGLVVLPVCLLLCLVAFGVFWCLDEQDVQTQSYIGMEKGTALTDEEAESILLGDISDEDWEAFESSNASICEIISSYSNEDGYIDEDDVQSVVNEVAGYVNSLYEKDTVSYYIVSDEDVYFEYASGLGAYYTPAIEGCMSGSGDVVLSALSIDPYAYSGSWANYPAYVNGQKVMINLGTESDSDFCDVRVTTENYANKGVGIGVLLQLPECNILLWQGHGGSTGEQLFLVTQTQATNQALKNEISSTTLSVKDVKASLVKSDYWAITPSFVEKHISVDEGMVYLSACKSGYTDEFANVFLSKGAKVVFVNTDTVQCDYTAYMMSYITDYMSGEVDGVYYTAQEALAMGYSAFNNAVSENGIDVKGDNDTVIHFDTLADYVQELQNGAHVEIRGDEDYTIVSTILVSIAFDDDCSAEEQTELLPDLSVRLTAEDGTYKDYTPDEVDFFINKMDAGTYTVTLYEGETVVDEQTVEVESHHRAEVTLTYESGNSGFSICGCVGRGSLVDFQALADVDIMLVNEGGSWSDHTNTDEDGYFSINCPEGVYTITCSKDGYKTVEWTWTLVSGTWWDDLDRELQPGDVIEIEAFTLEELPSWKEIYGEYVQKIADDDIGGWSEHTYALVYVDNDDVPELYVGGVSEAEGDRICTIDSSGAVVECWLNRMGGAAYIERSGMFYNYNGNNGILTLDFYSLADGVFTKSDLSAESVTTYNEESDDFIPTYKWEGKSVSEEVFYANWDSVMARDRATSFYAVSVSASELLDLLVGNDDIGGADLIVYASVVQQYENTYGTIGYNIYYQNQEARTGEAYMLTGLCLVQPIDFDGDSVYELLIGYGETVDASTGQTEVCGDVWGLDGDTPVLLYSGASFPGESYYNAIAYKSEGGVCYLYDGYSENRFAHVDIYGLEDGSFTKVYALEADFSSDSPHYTLNGTAISMTEYAGYVSDGLIEFYAQVSSLEDFETCRVNLEEIYDEMDLQ